MALATAGCGRGIPVSPGPTAAQEQALPVFAQSLDGTAVEFTLPKGWSRSSATRPAATFTHGNQVVGLLWAEAPVQATQASQVFGVAAAEISQWQHAKYARACVTSTTPSPGRLVIEAESPCQTPHSASLADPAVDAPVVTTPAGGGHRLELTWIATAFGEAWVVVYDAPVDAFDNAVTSVISSGVQLQQSALPSMGRPAIVGAAPAQPIALPASFVSPARVSPPGSAAAGASATDACQLIRPSDLAGIAGLPPSRSMNHVTSTLGASSVCQVQFSAAETPPLGVRADLSVATLSVSIFSRPLADVVASISAKDGLNRRGVISSASTVPVFATLANGPGESGYSAEAYLAATANRTVRITFDGPGDEISLWDQQILAVATSLIGVRLSSGKLAAPLPTAQASPRPGAQLNGLQFGQSTVSAGNVCELLDPSAATLVGGGKLTPGKLYPPSCKSAGPVMTIDVARWDGSLATDAHTNILVPRGAGATTAVVNGVTVIADDGGPPPATTAAVAISPDSWAEVTVYFSVGHQTDAVRVRDRLVQQVTARAAAG